LNTNQEPKLQGTTKSLSVAAARLRASIAVFIAVAEVHTVGVLAVKSPDPI
jgi:hypothetical protein